MTAELTHSKLLTLLQLSSPTLPIGAYSYSEGIETLATNGTIATRADLLHWLEQELYTGSIRLETAILRWTYGAAAESDHDQIERWDQWLSALRETAEMRSQSWQMGRSLLRLFADLEPELAPQFPAFTRHGGCNFAIAYSLVAQAWQIPVAEAAIAFLHSWAANLISAAVRAVPLGQTEGQRLLQQLTEPIQTVQAEIAAMDEGDLTACNWGVSLASMQHEALYSRLFRS
ncbi:MAG: urease accessory protein UreF [Leptolyngbya sp. SIOISBB]|nr:urease accessory protein UreF [Leptolyngbya sp. SIOISBB]